jgi:hypothetical protein
LIAGRITDAVSLPLDDITVSIKHARPGVFTGPSTASAVPKRSCARQRFPYPNGVEPASEKIPDVTLSVFDGYSGHEALDRLNQLIAMAPFHVEVSREFPLEAAADAMRDVTRHHVGKLALAVAPR